MSIEVAGFKPGIHEAGADLSTKQFLAVKISADFKVDVSGDGELSMGVLQNDPVLGEAAEIEMDGISKAIIGAAVAFGAKLAADAAGKLITAVATKHVVAIAQEAGGGANEVIAVKVVGAAGQLLA